MTLNATLSEAIELTARRLVARLEAYGPVAVAYSGGVDSAVVAKAAVEAWGERAVAMTAVSPSLAALERELARREALSIGIRHVEFFTQEFARDEYRRNAGDRCYFCKDTLYMLAKDRLAEFQVNVIVNGANLDDLGDHRPGMQAALDHSVRSPLIEESINKATVRELARFWGLTVASKPAAPCLASRIAYGVEVTEERVRRVEHAEAFLMSLTGITELRVRCEAGELARIEVPRAELGRFAAPEICAVAAAHFRQLGFRCTTLDLEGLRSGSLNELLPILPS